MDFTFSDSENEIAQLARTILDDLATNELLRAHENSGNPHDAALWAALAKADLLGLAIPEADGGSGLGFLSLCRFLQEIGRAVAPVPAYSTLVLGAMVLGEFGDADQRAILPEVAAGRAILTAALHEADSSDPLAPTTSVDANGAFTGVKLLVPSGTEADRILVPARAADGSIALGWFSPSGGGVKATAQRESDGLAAASLELTNATPIARLDSNGNGAEILRWLVERAIVARCMMMVGVTERALEMTGAYGRERVQFERPIGSFQAFHQRAADAYIHIESMRLTTWEAAWRIAEGKDATSQVTVAKYCAAEGGAFASFACQHLHGGIGIDVDYPLHRYFKWAIQLEHEFGSARHQLTKLGRAIAANGVPAEV